MSAFLPKPTIELVRELGTQFDSDHNTALIEYTLARLVGQFPRNEDIRDVLLKVTTINALYSTNIYAVVALAEHIAQLNIDSLLVSGDPEAVELVAKIRFNGDSKERHNYSFASKYCSWHNRAAFPIYDSRVRSNLWRYKKQDRFHNFSSNDVWCYNGYRTFRQIVSVFRSHYGLAEMNFKEIDKFLYWFDPKGNYNSTPLSTQEVG
jgi:hypothetical protein